MEPSKEQKIEAYLAESLPASEERIPEPMSPACQVCVVIPAYGEREIILRPLESLACQKDVTSDQFEVIIVVNNADGPPAKEPGQTEAQHREKLENYTRVLENNRETLELIKHLKGQRNYTHLTREEEKAIGMIRQFGLKVFAVDKSGKGRAFPKADANVGGARNRGAAEAVERFYKLGRNGILAHTDADTRLDDCHIRNLIDAFKNNPRLTGLTGFDEDTLVDPWDSGMMEDSLMGQAVSTYEAMVFNMFIKEGPSIYFSGTNMASRAFETASIGGIARVTGAEDTYLAQKLNEIGEIVWDKKLVAFPAIRYSLRTTTGRGKFMSQCADNEKERKPIMVRSIEAAYHIFNIYTKLQEARKKQQTSAADLSKYLIIDNEPILDNQELERLSRDIHQMRSYIVDLWNHHLKELFHKICARIDDKFKPLPIVKAIPLLIKMYCMNERTKKKFQAVREYVIQGRKQDLQTLQYLVDKIFQNEHQKHHINSLTQILTSLLEKNPSPLTANFFKKEHRIKKVAELMALSHTKAQAMELIKLNFMKYLLLPDLPGTSPGLSASFELQVLEKTMRSLY